MPKPSRNRRERGLTVVENAIILPLVMLVVFGIIEGCRLLASQELLENAGREAARLARVSTTTLALEDIQAAAIHRFSGNTNAPGLTILVYKADPVTGQNLGAWTDAGRGDCIAVEATFSHTVVLPMFGLLPNNVTLHSKSVVYSEGN